MKRDTDLLNIYSSERISDRYICINSCNAPICYDRDCRADRVNGRVDYQLIYILEGRCHVLLNNEDIVVEQDEVILFRPNEPQKYCFYQKDHASYCYIHFTGSGCSEIFDRLQLSGSVFKFHKSSEIKSHFLRIRDEFCSKKSNFELICEGMLITLLALISKYNTADSDLSPADQKSSDIMRIMEKITSHPQRALNLEECAAECNLSKSRFISVFKSCTGYPPHKYLVEVRMIRAKELLLYTDYTIGEIASAVGYDNQNFFARAFKKSIGMSPSEYRKK